MLTSSRLYVKKFIFDKSSSIKQTIYQNLHDSNGNTFSFIPHVCYFSYHPSIAASEARNLTPVFSTKMRGSKHCHKNINIPVQFYQHSITPPLHSVKTIIKLRLSMRDIYINRGLCIFCTQMLETVSISFINCELVRTLYSVGLLSIFQGKQ